MIKTRKLLLFIFLLITAYSGFFGFTVFADADKVALNQAYDNIVDINTQQDNSPLGDPYYEEDSYQAFTDAIDGLGGLPGIQAVIDDPLALQIDVDNLTTDINNAIAGLILSDTYYITLANFSQAKTLDLTPYTSDSQTLYNNEMDRIEFILNDPTAGDAAIDALNADIDAAEDLLVLRGDKTDLLSKKTNIESIYNSDGTDYIPSTFNDFKDGYDGIDSLLLTDIGMTLQQLIDDVDATISEVSVGESRLDEILNILVSRPNKQDLIDDYNVAVLLDEEDYTTTSFTLFEQGLSEILDIINDVEATQTDVDQAMLDLEDLYDILIDRADITDLLDAYNNAIAQNLSIYTPNSVVLYQAELNRINDIMISNETDQNEADTALEDLYDAQTLLVLQADRSELFALNNLIIKAYYEDKSLYTTSSFQAFQNAVIDYGSYQYVNSVVDNDNIDQAFVDALAETLKEALNLLSPLVDNSELILIYYEYENLDLDVYTQISQDAFNAELDRIYNVLTGKEFDSDAYKQIVLDMLVVADLFVRLPDVTELRTLYDSTSIYREEDYSITSYGAFVIAKDAALDVINNKNSNETMIQDAIDSLTIAVSELQRKAEKIYIIEGNTLDLKPYVTLGQASIVGYDEEDPTIVSVSSRGVLSATSYGETQVYIELDNGYTEILDIYVKAKVNTAVYVLTFSLPVVSVGLGVAVIYIKKETWINLWSIIKNLFKKKS